MTSLPERAAAVYRAVRAGGRKMNRALFAALLSNTLCLINANSAWTNMVMVRPAGPLTGFTTDCPSADALVEAGSARPRALTGDALGGCTACGTAATARCRMCAGAASFH